MTLIPARQNPLIHVRCSFCAQDYDLTSWKRFSWRDLGFVFGAVGIGFIADTFDLNIAIQTVEWISLGSGIFVLRVMQETRKIV
jgi:hypothetical protein